MLQYDTLGTSVYFCVLITNFTPATKASMVRPDIKKFLYATTNASTYNTKHSVLSTIQW